MPESQQGECSCGVLELMTDESKCPVEFDPELNEFHIIEEGNSRWIIRFCPFCGCRTPKSRRARLFYTLTDDERQRLFKLTEGYRTLDQVIEAFGQPDIDHPVGVISIPPERDGRPEIAEGCRVVIYTRLSDTADVNVRVHPTGVVRFGFSTKPITKYGC